MTVQTNLDKGPKGPSNNHPNRGPKGPASNPTPSDVVAARKEAGLTQTEAACLIYATRRAWQEWEAGNRRMHPGLWELFNIKLDNRKLVL